MLFYVFGGISCVSANNFVLLRLMSLNHTILHADATPQMLVLQLSAEHEREGMAEELRLIRGLSDVPFVLCRAEVSDWDAQLSPWQAPPAFGKENFAGFGTETLQQITSDILPAMQQQYGQLPVCIAGYSLAGLFALWAAVQSDSFQAVAAASPSVWFPGWTDYAEKHPLQAKTVYLSLGDKEDRSRLPLLRTVSDCIRRQDELMKKQGIQHLLEWNEGNHFRNPELRTAKAIAWCMENNNAIID